MSLFRSHRVVNSNSKVIHIGCGSSCVRLLCFYNFRTTLFSSFYRFLLSLIWVQPSMRIDFDVSTFAISLTRNEFSSNFSCQIQLYPTIRADTAFETFSARRLVTQSSFIDPFDFSNERSILRTKSNIRLPTPFWLATILCDYNLLRTEARTSSAVSALSPSKDVLRTIFRRECSWFHQSSSQKTIHLSFSRPRDCQKIIDWRRYWLTLCHCLRSYVSISVLPEASGGAPVLANAFLYMVPRQMGESQLYQYFQFRFFTNFV